MHLVLLVGTNPIPNYVAAIYGARNGVTRYYLVHTAETEAIAKALENQISEALNKQAVEEEISQVNITCVPLEDASNNEKIYAGLKDGLAGIPDNAEIILNYTGGTKAMAIHAYTWINNHRKNVKFQYLDARTHKIITDSKACDDSPDLRDRVSMDSIDTMLKLHGYTPFSLGYDPYESITKQLGIVIDNGQIETFLRMTRLLRTIYYTARGICVQKRRLLEQLNRDTVKAAKQEFDKLLEANAFLYDILRKFPPDNCIIQADGTLWVPTDDDTNGSVELRTKGCIHDYLDGKWLEYHVLRAVSEIAKSKKIAEETHFGNSKEAWKPGDKSHERKPFELDLFVLRGYQLTCISVTTGGGGEAKMKAFEVMHRARQIGGDEARGILVADLSYDNRQKVDRVAEMESDVKFLFTGSTSDYFRVIGRDDWQLDRLTKKLEGILW